MTTVSERIRVLVRDRAKQRCEYCQTPDRISTYGYHVDHIVPVQHGGISEPENLAWACFECNVHKGRDVASYDPHTGDLTPLYNPRTQNWEEHFQNHAGFIEPQTAVGRVTVQLLSMNEPDLVETRHNLMLAGQW